MLKEKDIKVLRKKVGVAKVKDIRHIVDGPSELVKQLPNFIGSTPKDKTLVMIVTDNDYVDKIKLIETPDDMSDEMIDQAHATILQTLDYDKQVIFCLYVSEPDKYHAFADDLMSDYGADVIVRDILYITDTHWGSYLCSDKDCCPDGGREIER